MEQPHSERAMRFDSYICLTSKADVSASYRDEHAQAKHELANTDDSHKPLFPRVSL